MALDNYTVWLRANPQAIVADSHASTTISAEVRDSNGRAVPDGTQVEFTTSLGIIERSAGTEAGVARVRLQSGSTTGTALVSAVVTNGRAVGKFSVEFLEPGTEMFDESFISVESNAHLGYDVDTQVVDSAGGVRIYSRGLTIDADAAQIDVRANILKAVGRVAGKEIVVARGDKQITASALVYDLNSMKGVFISPAADGARRMLLRGNDLFVQPDTDPSEKIRFEFQPVEESDMFIRARSLLIRPGVEIKIKRASFYVDGEKIVNRNLHVVPLRSRSGGMDQILTYGTGGLRLDLPFYYSLSANGTGALRVKHSQPGQWGYYSGESGWRADIEQEYNYGGSIDGKFSLNRITSGNWGASWNHRMEFNNNSHVYTYLDFPEHKDIYGTVDYRLSLNDYTLSLYARGNKVQDREGRYSSSLGLQSRSKPLIGNAVSYAFSTRVSYSNQLTGSDKIGTGVGLQLYGKNIQFGSAANLTTSMSVSQEWGGGYPGTSMFANAGYYHNLGTMGSLGLNYSYAWGSADNAFSSQRLSGDLSLKPSEKWDTRLYATHGLDDGSLSAFGEFNYTFMRSWRLGVMGTYQSFKGIESSSYSDYELALSKIIGNHNTRLIWSNSRKRFRLEFTPLSF